MADLCYYGKIWLDVTHPDAEDNDKLWTTITRQQIPEPCFQWLEIRRTDEEDESRSNDHQWQVTVWQANGVGAIPVYRTIRFPYLNKAMEDPIIQRSIGGNQIGRGGA